MALPSSGAISLNQMHIEAGGASGTIVSLNDADIRDMISKGSEVIMSFSEWYGASSGPAIERAYSTYNYQTNTFGKNSSWWEYSGFVGNEGGSEIVWGNNVLIQKYTAFRTGDQNMNFYLQSYITPYNASGNPNYGEIIKNNVPFPAHTNAIGGWWYYHKRGDVPQSADFYNDDMDEYLQVYYHANRIDDNSSYPH